MSISTFTSAHVNTLCKLKGLADKHNCKIAFGTNVSCDDEVDYDLIEYIQKKTKDECKLTKKIAEDLREYAKLYRELTNCTSFWFELYDNNTGKHHILDYSCSHIHFGLSNLEECDISKKTLEWVQTNSLGWYDTYWFEFNYDETKLRGWDGINTKDCNVYREGMTLKFFGDLVCDYFGEPRIKEVY